VAISTCTNPRAAPPPAERILVIRLGAVGDVVRTLPAASALRAAYPRAKLAWLVEPASASVLAGQGWLDDVIVFPRSALRAALRGGRAGRLWRETAGFVRRLRAERFDLVVDFHAILKSGVLSLLSGAKRRVSYARPFAREGAAWFATERAQLAPPRQSRFDRNEALVRFLAIDAKLPARPLAVPEPALAGIAAALGPGPAPVVIHPGTSDATPYKRWTPAGYGAVARALAGEGVPCLVSSGPAASDREMAEAVLREAAGAARPAPPTPTLLDLAALFAHARLYLGADSGPMHVAALVGTPVVQLLGPTDPVENAPYPGTPSRTLRIQIACNPCKRGCDAATCMRSIPERAVLAAVRELLAGGGGHPVAAEGGHPVAAGGGRLVDCAGPRPEAQAEERPA
jgi:ADP-heptose:LPS heptosyltransferase